MPAFLTTALWLVGGLLLVGALVWLRGRLFRHRILTDRRLESSVLPPDTAKLIRRFERLPVAVKLELGFDASVRFFRRLPLAERENQAVSRYFHVDSQWPAQARYDSSWLLPSDLGRHVGRHWTNRGLLLEITRLSQTDLRLVYNESLWFVVTRRPDRPHEALVRQSNWYDGGRRGPEQPLALAAQRCGKILALNLLALGRETEVVWRCYLRVH